MRKLIVRVENLEEGLENFQRAWKSGKQQGEFATFETMAEMARFLTPVRWELLRVLQGCGPVSLRELARRLQRDVKAVHRDVSALKEMGFIEDDDQGRGIVVPYDEIRAEFAVVRRAA